jgi:hypothetical protein
MKERTPVPGVFQDDSEIFHRVYELTPMRPPELLNNDPYRLEVYVMSFQFEAESYAAIRDRLNSLYNQKKELPYRFSPVTEDDPFDNCATVQRQIGIPIQAFEYHEGDMGRYIDVFIQIGHPWKPEQGKS